MSALRSFDRTPSDSEFPGDAIIFESLPTSGLANQLRGLTSAMLMAEDLGRELHLSWNEHQDMPDTSLSDLFSEPILTPTTLSGSSFSRLEQWRFCHRNREVLNLRDQLKRAVFPHHQFNSIGCDMVATGINPASRRILISSYYSYSLRRIPDPVFYRRRNRAYQSFVLVPELDQAIKKFEANAFGDHTLGIHLRTGVSIRNAKMGIHAGSHFWPEGIPFQTFFTLIDEEIDAHPGTKILLATDNLSVCDPLLSRYEDRIIMYPKPTDNGMIGRSSLADHKNALVDLFLLARTQKLIGTYNSTFSYEAAVIGDVPFIEIGPMGTRQIQNIAKKRPVILDFRDREIRPVGHQWLKEDRTRANFSDPGTGRNQDLEFLWEQLQAIENPVVIDFGAGTGACSLLAKHVEGSRFYSFEEDPELSEILDSHIKLNNIESRVEIVNCAPKNVDEFSASRNLGQLDFIRIRFDSTTPGVIRGAAGTIGRFSPGMMIDFGHLRGRELKAGKASILDLRELRDYKVSNTAGGGSLFYESVERSS